MAGLGDKLGATATAARRFWRDAWVEPAALRAAARRAKPTESPIASDPLELGRSEIGEELIAGRFRFAGQEVRSSPETLWRSSAPSRAWAAAAHSFSWMADLAAVGDARAESTARRLVGAWLDRPLRFDPAVWALEVAARRSWALLSYAADFEAGAAQPKAEKYRKSLVTHAEWLERRPIGAQAGVGDVLAAGALVAVDLAFANRGARLGAATERLERALASARLGDGGPVSRAPSDAVDGLIACQMAAAEFESRGLAAPPALAAAMDDFAAVARFFRVGDGGVAQFHGGRALLDGRTDLALARTAARPAPSDSLGKSGFERLVGGRTRVFFDAGRAPEGPAAHTAHASCLSIEMSAGRRRLVVGCGSAVHLDEDWRRAGRGAAAHSMLSIDGATPGVFGAKREADAAFTGPPEVHVERREELNGVWVLGAHDGYLASHGLTVTRRMFLSADGGDFRGEDSLDVDEGGARLFERKLARDRAGRPTGGAPFTIRFHLHPDVTAEVVADGEAVTLRLPQGEVWVMRQAGGKLSLAPSVYFDAAEASRETRQIAVAGRATSEATQVRWAFRRIGELTQAPRDVAALLPFDDRLEGA